MTDRVARVRLPDGRIARVKVPEGTSEQQVLVEAENLFGRGITRTEDFGPESMKESMAKAAGEMGFGKSVVAGLGTRLMDYDARIRQLLGVQLSPQERQQVIAGREATGPVQAGRIGADILVGSVATPTGIIPNVVAGATQRFASDPVLENESAAQNALSGAIGGSLGYGGAKLAQHLVRPISPSSDVQSLAREGIIPTIGEAARSGGSRTGQVFGAMEDAATSYFGIGQSIGASRQRAGVEELGRAVLTRSTPRGMPVTERVGREGLAETYDAISSRYGDALQRIGLVREDRAFRNDVARRVNDAVLGLSTRDADNVRQIIQDIIGNRQSPVVGAYTADIAKVVDADLGQRARDFANSQDASGRIMSNAIRSAQAAWRDLLRRNAPDQETRAILDDANRAFANYVRAERAVNKSGATHGEFNAAQLAQAVRETAGGGTRRAAHARGGALMQDLSDPAKAVLSSRLGESGTVPRAMLGYLTSAGLGGSAIANEQLGGPTFLTGLLAAGALAPLAYSRSASRYAIGDLLPGIQNPGATFLDRAAPYAGLVGRSTYDK